MVTKRTKGAVMFDPGNFPFDQQALNSFMKRIEAASEDAAGIAGGTVENQRKNMEFLQKTNIAAAIACQAQFASQIKAFGRIIENAKTDSHDVAESGIGKSIDKNPGQAALDMAISNINELTRQAQTTGARTMDVFAKDMFQNLQELADKINKK